MQIKVQIYSDDQKNPRSLRSSSCSSKQFLKKKIPNQEIYIRDDTLKERGLGKRGKEGERKRLVLILWKRKGEMRPGSRLPISCLAHKLENCSQCKVSYTKETVIKWVFLNHDIITAQPAPSPADCSLLQCTAQYCVTKSLLLLAFLELREADSFTNKNSCELLYFF